MGVEKVVKVLKTVNAVLAGTAGGLLVAKIIKKKKQTQLEESIAPVIEAETVAEKECYKSKITSEVEGTEYKLCPNCSNKININAKFCKYCGNSTISRIRYCSNCGSELTEGANFCIECGEKV